MRGHDWSTSPLGQPESWPQSLRSMVGMLINSKFPMFLAWGTDFSMLYNDAYGEILGNKHPSAVGARMQDIWAEIWVYLTPKIEQAISGQAVFEENLPLSVFRKGYYEKAWFTFSYSPIYDESGQVGGMFCAVVETTETVRALAALQASESELKAMNQRKDEFLAMLAHELRNPLAPISSAAEMLRIIAHSDPKIIRVGEVINRQLNHLTALVDDLLDVARVTKGLIELDRQVVDFDLIIQSAVEQSRPLLEERKHTLSVQGSASHAMVVADRNRIIQVLTNLLNNAAKYTTEAGHIILSVSINDENVVVEVEDNGVGIEPELIPRIFDLFTQAQRTPDRLQGGLGIGLALVKTIMTLHAGQILVSSDGRGAGSKFTMLLPKVK